MEFCNNCDNMLYIKNDENNNLVKYCKHCDYSKKESESKYIKISESRYLEDDLLYEQNKNKYLRFDPTLRRIKDSNIICPNKPECNVDIDKQQIISIKYDNTNMKYFYVCDYCGYTWRQKNE